MTREAAAAHPETVAGIDGTYEELARVFSRVYAETGDIATTLEVLDAHRARQAVIPPPPDLPDRILAVAAALFHVPPQRLLRPGRHRDLCFARWIAAWILHQHRWSTVRIGRFLGLDHSTVLHGLRRVAGDHRLLLLARDAAQHIETATATASPRALE